MQLDLMRTEVTGARGAGDYNHLRNHSRMRPIEFKLFRKVTHNDLCALVHEPSRQEGVSQSEPCSV